MGTACEAEETISEVAEEPAQEKNRNSSGTKSVKTKVPEVEVHLFRQGRGPIDVFRSGLGGWDRDRLEVQDILDKYGFKSIFAFNPTSGRSVPIRFNHKNGRSTLPYADGSVIYVDGEPKDSLLKPITKILVGVAMLTLLIAVLVRETPEWFNTKWFTNVKFPPWVLACAVIAFTRLRKRAKDVLKKYGW